MLQYCLRRRQSCRAWLIPHGHDVLPAPSASPGARAFHRPPPVVRPAGVTDATVTVWAGRILPFSSTVKKDQPDSDHIPQWKKSLDDDSAYLVHIPM